MEILKVGLIFGIIGHVINMWCDRVLSITPNGKLTLSTMNNINDHQKMAELYEGVDPSVPIGGLPLWALIFTILPIFIVLVPFKIIGSLHISAIITFLGWMFLI